MKRERRPHRYSGSPVTLDPATWPAAERQAWERLFVEGDVFDGTVGPAAYWRPATRRIRQSHLTSWLRFWHARGELGPLPCPTDRMTPENIRRFVQTEREVLAPRTIAEQVLSLAVLARAMAPEKNWRWLKELATLLKQRSVPVRERNLTGISSGDVLAWALARMEQLKADGIDDPYAAVAYRDALVTGLLIGCPAIRRGNLVQILIGRHLRRSESGYRLSFTAAEMKQNRRLDLVVPEELTAPFDYYISHVRQVLLRQNDSDVLWIGLHGKPIRNCIVLYFAVRKIMRREFGVVTGPHGFRTIAATSIAIHAPEHAGTIHGLLDHTTAHVTDRHYLQADGIRASRSYRGSVDRMRRKK